MPVGLSPYFTFPPLSWWAAAQHCDEVWLDETDIFRKMTYRNRYRIATANGLLQLSIPLQGGRSQRLAMKEVLIDNNQNWQKQHWRALFSAYGRAPFYEYYGPELDELIKKEAVFLKDFNIEAINWVARKLRLKTTFREGVSMPLQPIDIQLEHTQAGESLPTVAYPQVFEDRYGFLANISIIDLLMNEGPASTAVLREMAASK